MNDKTIYNLFRTLVDGNNTLLSGINLLEGGALPAVEARRLAEQIWLALVPAPPVGRKHFKESFWAQGCSKFVWMALVIDQPNKTKWLSDQMALNRHKVPSVFQAIPNTPPQPRTGK